MNQSNAEPIPALPQQEEPARKVRQRSVGDWAIAAFGSEEATSLPQRGIRLFEEAGEAAQATGVTADIAHKMVDYVWSRPIGELSQELGGIGVTVLALAQAASLDADECEVAEVDRVLSNPIAHFSHRNKAKNDAGFLVAAPIAPLLEQEEPIKHCGAWIAERNEFERSLAAGVRRVGMELPEHSELAKDHMAQCDYRTAYRERTESLTQALTSLAAANEELEKLNQIIEGRDKAILLYGKLAERNEIRAELAESKLSEALQTIEELKR